MNTPRLAILVPCYNEEAVIDETDRRLQTLLDRLVEQRLAAPDSFVMYGDDGSRDATWEHITAIRQSVPGRVHGLRLAANAGHQNMLLALLSATVDHADVTITIDADLQDDIRAMETMLLRYREGYDVVLGVRDRRDSDTLFKSLTARGYYKLLTRLGVKSVYNHADYRLMSRRATLSLLEHDERNVYLRGLVCSLGYPTATVSYNRGPRLAGETKYPLSKMINLAVDGITSFSVKPVRMVFGLGILFLLIALGILVYVLYSYICGTAVPGWSSIMLSIWFCSGIILLCLGIVGEYIAKIYIEVKHRPRYHIDINTLE